MSKKNDTWMPLYIGDYLADTSRLSTEQHGAYLLILMDYWRNGPPLDDDEELANITKLSTAQWKKHAAKIRALFRAEGGRLIQKRSDAERARAGLVSSKRSEAGKQGAAARWGKQAPSPDAKTDGKPMANGMASDMANASQNDGPSQSQSQYPLAPPSELDRPACAPAPACEGRPTPSEAAPSPPEAPPPAPPPPPPAPVTTPQAQGTPYGAITRRLMAAGISRANPGNLLFRELVDAGVTADEFLAYRDRAIQAEDPFAYLLGTVRNERKRAKFQAAQLQLGAPTPQGRPPAPQSFRQQDEEAAMRRWEEATGRVHPDRQRPQDPRPVGPDVIDMESPALPALEHDDAA
jgi:uncharacterized protein YdaU (DUF1376 family)